MIGVPKFDPYPVGVWINWREETLRFEMLNQKNEISCPCRVYRSFRTFVSVSTALKTCWRWVKWQTFRFRGESTGHLSDNFCWPPKAMPNTYRNWYAYGSMKGYLDLQTKFYCLCYGWMWLWVKQNYVLAAHILKVLPEQFCLGWFFIYPKMKNIGSWSFKKCEPKK